MSLEEEFKKRVARKLTKRRKERHRATIDMPERFRDGEDADEDCTAPQGANAYMNQSVFGMIAAAGSQVDFNARFDAISSDDEEGPAQRSPRIPESQRDKASQDEATTSTKGGHSRRRSDYAAIQAPEASSRSKSTSRTPSVAPPPALELPSGPSSPEVPAHRLLSGDASVMKRMLEARAELSTRASFDMPRPTEESIHGLEDGASESLAKRLMEIFGFDSPEPVLSGRVIAPYSNDILTPKEEYPCWLLQSVLLQGYLYITTKHVCFYAYLPKKSVSPPIILLDPHLTLLERGCQVWIPIEIWKAKPQIPSILVPS